jgi:hypothetical protein
MKKKGWMILNQQFSLIPGNAAHKLAVADIIRCNQTTSKFGLVLTTSDASELDHTRSEVLEKVGRIEFAGGVISKLIMEFCDSPYLNQSSYAETLHELIETFYYFKNETLEELDDDELIARMKKYFDETCRGSVELLQERDLENLARDIRYEADDYDEYSSELDNFTVDFYYSRNEFEPFEDY